MTASFSLSPQARDLYDQLSTLHNWQDIYRAVIVAAQKQAPLAEEYRTPDYQVDGCEAQVWLKPNHSDTAVHFEFASQSRMIFALTYAALLPLQGQPPQLARQFDVEQWLQQCNLVRHLAPSRSNGVYQIIRAALASI